LRDRGLRIDALDGVASEFLCPPRRRLLDVLPLRATDEIGVTAPRSTLGATPAAWLFLPAFRPASGTIRRASQTTKMNIGVLGTGMVGQSLATRLIGLGHTVTMGARSPDNEVARGWAERAGENAGHGTFEDAAAFGEVVVNCTAAAASAAALEAAGEGNLNAPRYVWSRSIRTVRSSSGLPQKRTAHAL
jgi:hypothetical protein